MFQQLARSAQVEVDMAHFGPPTNDHSHVQRVNPQPYLGMSAPQPRQPVQNSPHVMPSVPSAIKGPNPDQGIDTAFYTTIAFKILYTCTTKISHRVPCFMDFVRMQLSRKGYTVPLKLLNLVLNKHINHMHCCL